MSLKKINEAIGEFLEPINIKKRFPNYVFNRPLFYMYIAVVAMIVLALGQTYGFQRNEYFACSFGTCEHPDGYNVTAPYEEGVRPPSYVKNFSVYAFLGLGAIFLINHLAFNRRKKIK